jgi:hypothetical protein
MVSNSANHVVLILLGEITMAKSASAVPAVDSFEITSLKDGAYKQAVATDRMRGVARYVMALSKAFPESVSDEIKEQLYEGYRLRFNEVNKPETYAVVNDHYILIDGSNPDLEKEREKVVIGVDYCYAYSQQQYGKLKNENPNLHAVIKGWRDRTSSYCSNRLADLKRQARTIMNEGKTRDRAATIDFAQRITETFKGDQGLIVKCKNAFARGDATANEARLKTAIDAFMVKWNA